MSTKQHTDVQTLVKNLRDLDYVSRKVSNEFRMKNEILKSGLKDCEQCRRYVDNTRRNK